MVALVGMILVTVLSNTMTAVAQYDIPEPGGSVKLRPLTAQEEAKVYLIQQVGVKEFRQWDRVISAESEWKQEAINQRTGDYCLAQINEDAWDGVAKRLDLDYKNDYKDCLELALIIKKEKGWSAWNSSKHRWSKAK